MRTPHINPRVVQMADSVMPVFFKPHDGWAGDFIPFHRDGEFHLFYLKDYRDERGKGPGTPWFHLGTRDLVAFTDYGQALARGGGQDQDMYVYTGCVIEAARLFHIYYTGHNPTFAAAGRPQEAVMHATSSDLVRWTKDPSNPILFADSERYEPDDWRDPFVFWNPEASEFWMLLAARLRLGPHNRRGCVAMAASTDLSRWEIRDPFWAPGLYYTHECPDLFQLGDWWYLVFSEFSDRTLTRYRMSRKISGPWTAPPNDSFDGRAFYAAKTATDGTRRLAFGWMPTRSGDEDKGNWQWGGHLVVHELVQHSDGSLSVGLPAEVGGQFGAPVALKPEPQSGRWDLDVDVVTGHALDQFAWCRLGLMPATCCFETTITYSAGTRGCGAILRSDDRLDSYYQVRLEPGLDRLVFDRYPRPGDQPFMIERPLTLRPSEPVRLRILIEESAIVVYVNNQLALSARGYDHPAGACAVFVSEGNASFGNSRLVGRLK